LFAIDDIAYTSRFVSWAPIGKLSLTAALLVGSLQAGGPVVPLAVLTAGLFLIFFSIGFHFPKIVALALAEAMVVIFIGCLAISLVNGGRCIWSVTWLGMHLSLSEEGINTALLVFTRSLAGMSVMLFLATSTPMPHLAQAMRQLRVPAEIVELVMLIYRYSFLLIEQLGTMWTAAACRLGFHGYRNSFRTVGRISVGLFIRSMDMADRALVALKCRNFNGNFVSYRQPARMTWRWAAASIIVFVSLFILNTFTENWMHIGL